MKHFFWILALLSALTMNPPVAVSVGQPFGKITLPLGKVEIKTAGQKKWKKARPRQQIFEQDTIRTAARSRCEILLIKGGKIRLSEKTELLLTEANVQPMIKEFKGRLKKGSIWVSVRSVFGERRKVAIRMPTAVAAIRGTVFQASAGAEQSSVKVYQGSVAVNGTKGLPDSFSRKDEKSKLLFDPPTEISPPSEVSGPFEVSLETWISIVEGMQITVRKDGKYDLFPFDTKKDLKSGFVQWNKELDTKD